MLPCAVKRMMGVGMKTLLVFEKPNPVLAGLPDVGEMTISPSGLERSRASSPIRPADEVAGRGQPASSTQGYGIVVHTRTVFLELRVVIIASIAGRPFFFSWISRWILQGLNWR
jgi:hypothetical protein